MPLSEIGTEEELTIGDVIERLDIRILELIKAMVEPFADVRTMKLTLKTNFEMYKELTGKAHLEAPKKE